MLCCVCVFFGMKRKSIFFALCFAICAVEKSLAMGTYYWSLPGTQGMISYPAPYQPYAAVVPSVCEEEESSEEEGKEEEEKGEKEEKKGKEEEEEGKKEEEEGEEKEKEGEKEEGEKEEEKGKEEEEEGEKEEKEGEKEEKEGEEEEEEGEKEEKEEKEEPKKKKGKKYIFPPISYTIPAKPVQQYVYSAPYMPYKSFSGYQQPFSYPYKGNYYYYY